MLMPQELQALFPMRYLPKELQWLSGTLLNCGSELYSKPFALQVPMSAKGPIELTFVSQSPKQPIDSCQRECSYPLGKQIPVSILASTQKGRACSAMYLKRFWLFPVQEHKIKQARLINLMSMNPLFHQFIVSPLVQPKHALAKPASQMTPLELPSQPYCSRSRNERSSSFLLQPR